MSLSFAITGHVTSTLTQLTKPSFQHVSVSTFLLTPKNLASPGCNLSRSGMFFALKSAIDFAILAACFSFSAGEVVLTSSTGVGVTTTSVSSPPPQPNHPPF